MGNAKLNKRTAIFSIPAGHTCPAALLCKSKADRITGKLTDGPQCEFRCFAATGENLFKVTRESRWRNWELLKACKGVAYDMANLISLSLPKRNTDLCRVNASGDFFSQAYFDAWLLVASSFPNIIFYAYTKQLHYWAARLPLIPSNLRLVASRGGLHDVLIEKHNLRNVKVVFSESEAIEANLPLDHDDTHAWKHTGNFALLLHGTQPAGSIAGKVVYSLRKQGKGGYKADYFKSYTKKG